MRRGAPAPATSSRKGASKSSTSTSTRRAPTTRDAACNRMNARSARQMVRPSAARSPLHRPARLGLAQRGAGFGEAAQERGGGPTLAVLLMPRLDLAVDLGHPDAVGPVHQPAAVAWEAKAAQPHHIDVAGAVGLAFFEDLAGLVDRGEEQPAQDLLVAEGALPDPHLGRLLLDDAGDFGVGIGGAVALLVAEP